MENELFAQYTLVFFFVIAPLMIGVLGLIALMMGAYAEYKSKEMIK